MSAVLSLKPHLGVALEHLRGGAALGALGAALRCLICPAGRLRVEGELSAVESLHPNGFLYPRAIYSS